MPEPSELTAAIYRRDSALVSELLQRGATPSFFDAAALGDAGAIEKFLDSNPSLVTQLSPDGFTALHLAAFFGRPDVVEILLQRGADVAVRSNNAMHLCAIHSAAASGNAAVMAALLARDVDPDARQAQGFTALHEAALNGNLEMIRALLAKGANPNVTADDGRTAIDFARVSKNEAAIAALQTA